MILRFSYGILPTVLFEFRNGFLSAVESDFEILRSVFEMGSRVSTHECWFLYTLVQACPCVTVDAKRRHFPRTSKYCMLSELKSGV